MAEDLVLYTNPRSRGRIARWMLEETGQPYRVEVLEFGTTMKAPDYLAINPAGKVPALLHGSTVVTETGAICAYLADAFPDASLAPPPGDRARGDYYRWLFFVAGPLEGASTCSALGFPELPADKQAFIGHGSLANSLRIVEAVVAKRHWLAGDRFSAADLYMASMAGFMMMTGAAERLPALEAYCKRCLDRPAHQRADQLDGPMSAS